VGEDDVRVKVHTATILLLAILAGFTAYFIAVWLVGLRKTKVRLPRLLEVGIGFGVSFFDTLGIGSFATTTSLFKFWRVVRDENIPGTLNVGITLPGILEAFIFITIVRVDFMTLILLIAAAVAGAWIGAGIVARWPRRKIQIGMAAALLTAAALFALKNLNLFPSGGNALALHGTLLAFAMAANFCFGALMTLGIGLFAPCMIMVSLVGMNPIAAFPIMMGSCAFLMPIASARFIRFDRYAVGAALGLTIGGLPAVLLAAFIVKSLPLTAVRWLVIVVVVYAALSMLHSAIAERRPVVAPVTP